MTRVFDTRVGHVSDTAQPHDRSVHAASKKALYVCCRCTTPHLLFSSQWDYCLVYQLELPSTPLTMSQCHCYVTDMIG